MIRIATLASLAALLAVSSCSRQKDAAQTAAAPPYQPSAEFCANRFKVPAGRSPLCSTIPGNIGPDQKLQLSAGYSGIIGELPTSAQNDVQTPFDNLSWQTFIALNWTKGMENQPAEQGLQGLGSRVWEGWPRASEVFGDGPVQAQCTARPGVRVFSIASNGRGEPVAQNEEYTQAASHDPLIDVEGNWAIYERRLNDVEVAYLRAPNGNSAWTLTTYEGQRNLAAANQPVDFPAAGGRGAPTGAIEIKATWRVLDPAHRAANRSSFYVVPALLKVAPDLVKQGTPICAEVDMGLVAMHIIQKNPKTDNALLPKWFWSTFEHVGNAPYAKQPCDPASPPSCAWLDDLNCTADPGPMHYSFFERLCPDCAVNQAPKASATKASATKAKFAWNATKPYAKDYLLPARRGHETMLLGTQVSRCWKPYAFTAALNNAWRSELRSIGSVFQNYMLVGTQWGGAVDIPEVPDNAVPSYLSNAVVETYLQSKGSCVSCHSGATLPAAPHVSSNMSFLPRLAQPGLVRQKLQVEQEAPRAQPLQPE